MIPELLAGIYVILITLIFIFFIAAPISTLIIGSPEERSTAGSNPATIPEPDGKPLVGFRAWGADLLRVYITLAVVAILMLIVGTIVWAIGSVVLFIF